MPRILPQPLAAGSYPGPVTRTYEVRTYGCQMNVHDSERLCGPARGTPATRAPPPDTTADVVVFNTCAVRENADNRLYGNLGHLAPVKAKRPGMQIAVGGCLAQKDRDVIVRRAPWVDVVFGTHNIGSLPALLERARHNEQAQVEILESLEVFPSTLPTRRESAYAAWVSVSGRVQQHLHVLHRAEPARAGEGPPARATCSPRCARSSPKASSR
jgi:tRNA-2-methylthio-N6-dimethylallyladenosine synthase